MWNAQDYQQENGWYRPKPSGGGSPTFTPGASVAIQNIAFAAGVQTFTGLNGGVNFPAGAVVTVGVGTDQAALVLSTPLIGGVAASIAIQDSTKHTTFYQATMSGAAADTFAFTATNNVNIMGVAAGYFQNLSSSVVSATGTSTFAASGTTVALSSSPVVPASGFGLMFVWYNESSVAPPTSYVWANCSASGGDEFARMTTPTNASFGLAHTAAAGAWSPTAALTGGGAGSASAAVAATWN